MDPQVYISRVTRLVKLDTTVFEDMRDDPAGTVPAIVIAAISFFIAGVGGWLWWIISGYPSGGKNLIESVIVGTVTGTALWLLWILVAYFVLANVFHYTASFERMVRSCGLSAVPLAIGLLMFIPGINLGVSLAAFGLFFLLMDIGIQVSVDAQPGHVIAATFAGFAVFCIILSLLVGKDYYFAPNIFLFREPAAYLSDSYSSGTAATRAVNNLLKGVNTVNGR